jgi:hypothetical protein
MDANDMACANDAAFLRLQCGAVHGIDGIELENHIFLVSQLPCCAQIALPYWAKITGRIRNNLSREVLLNIVATLFDDDDLMLADYTDVIALDSGEQGEFEVKLIEYHDRAKTYAIAIKEMEQL